MSGHHNLRIYTHHNDGEYWCKDCLNGEYFIGTKTFKEGAYICYGDGIPTKKKCDGYCSPPKKDLVEEKKGNKRRLLFGRISMNIDTVIDKLLGLKGTVSPGQRHMGATKQLETIDSNLIGCRLALVAK